jgi:hypothetical protein
VSDSEPSGPAGGSGTRCTRTHVHRRHWCRARGRPAGLPSGRHLKRCRPLVVSFGQSPYLVTYQSKLLKCRPEWLNGVDRIEELLAQLDG